MKTLLAIALVMLLLIVGVAVARGGNSSGKKNSMPANAITLCVTEGGNVAWGGLNGEECNLRYEVILWVVVVGKKESKFTIK